MSSGEKKHSHWTPSLSVMLSCCSFEPVSVLADAMFNKDEAEDSEETVISSAVSLILMFAVFTSCWFSHVVHFFRLCITSYNLNILQSASRLFQSHLVSVERYNNVLTLKMYIRIHFILLSVFTQEKPFSCSRVIFYQEDHWLLKIKESWSFKIIRRQRDRDVPGPAPSASSARTVCGTADAEQPLIFSRSKRSMQAM